MCLMECTAARFNFGAISHRRHAEFSWLQGAWIAILIVLAVASMVLGNFAALAQTSVRRLLAYSAIAHAGYILLALAFFSYSSQSAQAILYYILTYGLTTIGAFGVGGGGGARERQRPDGCFPGAVQTQWAAGGCDAGAVSFAGRHSSAGRVLGEVQFVCGGAAGESRRRLRSDWSRLQSR